VLHRANAMLYAEILTALMLLFNGYLTAGRGALRRSLSARP
jgi:hypothetical protein